MSPFDLLLYSVAVLGAVALFIAAPFLFILAFGSVCGIANWREDRKTRRANNRRIKAEDFRDRCRAVGSDGPDTDDGGES